MDKATALKVLRGMLNLSQFDLTENQLRSQFLEYEGFEIPYKTFGFNTFLDFLRESNEFVLTTKSGFVYVRAKESKNSSHLVKYVAGQNKPKKKKNDKVMPFIPPLRKTLTNNNWSQKVRLNDMVINCLRLCECASIHLRSFDFIVFVLFNSSHNEMYLLPIKSMGTTADILQKI